jgi:hypothetical protein
MSHSAKSRDVRTLGPDSTAHSYAAHGIDLSQSGIHALDDDEISIHMKEGE